METEKFEEWVIMEMFGHIRLAGKVTEATILGGHSLLRLDIPDKDGKFVTQFLGPGSIFRMTPCNEDVARKVASQCQPEPVHRWEMPELIAGHQGSFSGYQNDYNDDESR